MENKPSSASLKTKALSNRKKLTKTTYSQPYYTNWKERQKSTAVPPAD
jgi:hypothetical protein